MSLKFLSWIPPHERICVPMVIPSDFSADITTAPAATRPAVIRPEKCPPPRKS